VWSWLAPDTDRVLGRALASRLILVGCPGLPMTQVPDFLLEIPNIRQPSAYSQARRRHWTGGPEADCAGRYEVRPYVEPVRHWLGERPTNFLNARLNAASDS